MNRPCTRRNLTWVLFFHNAKTEKFPSRLKKKREREKKHTNLWRDSQYPGVLCQRRLSYLCYRSSQVVARGPPLGHHEMVSVHPPTEPEIRGQSEVKKKVSVMRLKTGLFRQHPNGCTQIAPANVIYPMSCPMPATRGYATFPKVTQFLWASSNSFPVI